MLTATRPVTKQCNEGAGKSSFRRRAKRMDEDLVVIQRHVTECVTRLSASDRRAVLATCANSTLERPSIHTGLDRVVRRVRSRSSPSSHTRRAPLTHSVQITNRTGRDRTGVTMRYFADRAQSPQRHRVGQRNPWRVATEFRAALGDFRVTQHGRRGADCAAVCATISAQPSVPTACTVGHTECTSHSPLTPAVGRPNTAPPYAVAHLDDLRRWPRTLTPTRADQESESARRR